jgi:hypothetical protein
MTIETTTTGHLSILNFNGQELFKKAFTEPATTIGISNLPSGVYFIKIIGEKGVQVRKIIKYTIFGN